jgi:hypothetical protein
MIRKTYRCSPTVEWLESMVLLSGFSSDTYHAAPALLTKLPAASKVTNLSGTLKGTLTLLLYPSEELQTLNGLKGSGVVKPFGHTNVNGSFSLSGTARTFGGTFTLSTPKGNIVVDATKTLGPAPLSMTVTHGTRQLKGIVGSGSGTLIYVSRSVMSHGGGKFAANYNFSLTVNLNVTMPTG